MLLLAKENLHVLYYLWFDTFYVDCYEQQQQQKDNLKWQELRQDNDSVQCRHTGD